MKVLFVGHGGGGSWQIRGLQMARALGARATDKPSPADWSWADVVILVKHAGERYGAAAQASGARILWDVLDWWKQPEQNQTPIADLVADIHRLRDTYGIHTLIGSTQAMADDLGGVYLPHHSRPGLVCAPVRDRLASVAYEGTPKYLGPWGLAVANACLKLKIVFILQYAHDLQDADLVVAFRSGRWDGELCRRWKSGVKLSNSMASGRPILTHDSAAFSEMQPPGTIVEDPEALVPVMREWLDPDRRRSAQANARGKAADYTLEAVAHRYRRLLQSVTEVAA